MNDHIKEAIKIVHQGGVIIFPTDTAFGIGCRMDNEEAIKRLFMIRKRPETQATPVLVSGFSMAKQYWLEVPKNIKEELIDKFWPGALTVILPCKTEKVPEFVRGKGKNLGARMPNHEIALQLIEGVGVPMLGPSANFHGEATPYSFDELNPKLIKLVDYVVPGECSVKLASTVVDCSVAPWNILRQGAIQLKV